MERIVIIGLGLVGGSLGLALKKAKLKDLEIVGVDIERDAVVKASRKKAVDSTERLPSQAVPKASMVVVATPILAMPKVFQEMAGSLPPGCVVTDTASTKEQVLKWAQEFLPDHVHFVGGHPMAGKETSGIGSAEPDLFIDRSYCIVPSQTASSAAVDLVVSLAQTVGAKPYFVGAEEHDVLVGGISHLPLILSAALVSATTRSPSWREMSHLASTGFRDVSRLASGDPALGFGISRTNQANILRWIDGYIDVLKEYREMVAGEGDRLVSELESVLLAREKWLNDSRMPEGDDLLKEVPSASERMSELFLGSGFGRLMRKEQEMLEGIEKDNKKPRADGN